MEILVVLIMLGITTHPRLAVEQRITKTLVLEEVVEEIQYMEDGQVMVHVTRDVDLAFKLEVVPTQNL